MLLRVLGQASGVCLAQARVSELRTGVLVLWIRGAIAISAVLIHPFVCVCVCVSLVLRLPPQSSQHTREKRGFGVKLCGLKRSGILGMKPCLYIHECVWVCVCTVWVCVYCVCVCVCVCVYCGVVCLYM